MKIERRDRADRTASGDAAPCLDLTGRFDAFETAKFRSAIEELIDAGASTIWIDLSAISFVDSSALAELVRAHKRCRDLNGELVIVSPSDPVTVIFELTRLDAAFHIEREDTAVRRDDTAVRRDDTAAGREGTAVRRDDTAVRRDDTAAEREDTAVEVA